MTVNEEASKLINGPKREAYGSVETSFKRIARLWAEVLGVAVTPAQVALCMIQVKVSRELHRPDRDNRVDICGYAELLDVLACEPVVTNSTEPEPDMRFRNE